MADAPSQRGARTERPLSPHLQIYKPLINMVMSIVHRITGAALYFGTLLLAWWLIAAATGPHYFNYVSSWFQTLAGQADHDRLHLGAAAPHAWRPAAFHLGYRPRLRSRNHRQAVVGFDHPLAHRHARHLVLRRVR